MKFLKAIYLSKPVLMLSFVFGVSDPVFAKTVKYELNIEKHSINVSGKSEVDFALLVNGRLPAPTLEFTEGDIAEITVHNKLMHDEVSVHWHGILLPPIMDGVAYVNTPPIFPGQSFTFRFPIRQNGTYWYHSHTNVQEQKGVYGALVIHPKKQVIQADKDLVVVLSDWSDEDAKQIMKNLRKDGDYYLFKKDTVRSYWGAWQAQSLGSHLSNEWTRMGGMDLSDVGYDAFLMNGKVNSQLLMAHPGEKVRLRIINAAASSFFYVSLAGLPMKVIAADGIDIEPVFTKEILMGMAETYDVLFTVPEHKNYELRATVQDVTGYASGWIGMGEKVSAPDVPIPNLYAGMNMSGMDHESMGHSMHSHNTLGHGEKKQDMMDHSSMSHGKNGATGLSGMSQGSMSSHADMDHGGMDHSARNHEETTGHEAMDHSQMKHGAMNHSAHGVTEEPENTPSKDASMTSTQYQVIPRLTVDHLKAQKPTAFSEDKKVYDLKLVLGGDMERYIWHINGQAISQDRNIDVNEGDVV